MKNRLLLIVTLFIAISACKKESIVKRSDYEKSYASWVSFKQNSNNNYKYVSTFGSFSGYGSETTLSIVNGQVTARDYVQFKGEYVQNVYTSKTIKIWHEDKADIGSHQFEAADPLTLDQVYAKAKNEWLKVDPKSNDVYFEARNNGILSNCGYVPKGCQDDCFTGITISSITKL